MLRKDPNAGEFIGEKLRNAQWLIPRDRAAPEDDHPRHGVHRREAARVLREGVSLKPMILRDVAESVGMHESTISRVTTNKYVHTPQGLFELKYFFNSSIRRVRRRTSRPSP